MVKSVASLNATLHSDLWVEEFNDLEKILAFGAQKYGNNNWQTNDKIEDLSNFKSMSHHLLEALLGREKDEESGLDPLLHLAVRAMMLYTIRKRRRNE